MSNTTPDNVRDELRADDAISDLAALSDGQIQTIGIEPAHLEVSEDIAPETDYSDARLELIERYLAVDNILTSGSDALRRIDSENLGDGTSYSYSDVPSYRDKAKRIDRDGILDNLDKPIAGFNVPDSRGDVQN